MPTFRGRPHVQIADVLILGLASFRLTHLLVFDRIAAPVRRLIVGAARRGQPSQAGEDKPPAWTEVITCFWCCGVWVSALVALGWIYLPEVTRVPIVILAVAGAQAAIEAALRRPS